MGALAVIVAAGKGERMGGTIPKAFVPLGGVPMLVHCARAVDEARSGSAIVVVAPEDRLADARAALRTIAKPVTVVAGGARRQDSVRAGLDAAPPGFDGIVLVHDAARPFVDPALVDAVTAAAEEVGAAIPVLAVTDTIKRVEGGFVRETIDRSRLGAAQTPQGFAIALLRDACDAAEREGTLLTDESLAVERTGATVRAVPGAAGNRKVTTPDDLAWAEDVLRRREER
jgi:2-C-methyl-D-erythritol 4-phosphate cytidylyltransferase